jgi:hypothetical protein
VETKCFTNLKNCSAFIHPVGLASPSLPTGAPFKKWARKFTLGKMKNGGTVFPVAETARAKVTNFQRVPVFLFVCNHGAQ